LDGCLYLFTAIGIKKFGLCIKFDDGVLTNPANGELVDKRERGT
jgi:hypothetical protein